MANTIPTDIVHQEDQSGISITVAEVIESAGAIVAAGSAQGSATAVIHSMEWVTGADGTKGVVLPATKLGRSVFVKNDAAAILKVYPAGTDVINLLSASAAISMAAATSATFMCAAAGQWHTIPTVPS